MHVQYHNIMISDRLSETLDFSIVLSFILSGLFCCSHDVGCYIYMLWCELYIMTVFLKLNVINPEVSQHIEVSWSGSPDSSDTQPDSSVLTALSVLCCLLQEEARRHFNCPILEGMELENQGGTGTELNHWEKRLLEVTSLSVFGLKQFGFSPPLPPSLSLPPSEWGHDGLPHSEPGVFSADAGHHGG